MNFKKTTALFLAAAMTATALTACGGSDTNGGSADNGSAGGTITVDFGQRLSRYSIIFGRRRRRHLTRQKQK